MFEAVARGLSQMDGWETDEASSSVTSLCLSKSRTGDKILCFAVWKCSGPITSVSGRPCEFAGMETDCDDFF